MRVELHSAALTWVICLIIGVLAGTGVGLLWDWDGYGGFIVGYFTALLVMSIARARPQ